MLPLQLTYSLTGEDFLQQLLYKASKSERIKKKRLQSQLLALAAVLMLSFLSFENGHIGFMYAFLSFAVYTAIFYPRYLASHYKNHYKKFIAESYKARVDIESVVQADDQLIQITDRTGETKLHSSEIETVAETGNYFYLMFKTGECLIIPKSAITNSYQVKEQLGALCSKLNIPYAEELNWKWK